MNRPRCLVAIPVAVAALVGACRSGPHPSAAPPVSPSPGVSPASVPTVVPSPSPSGETLGKPVRWIRGSLHTVGTLIVDEQHHPVRLISMGVNGMQQGRGTPDTQPQPVSGCIGWRAPDPIAYGLIRSWGFNSVRLPFSWANLEPAPPTKDAKGRLVHHWNRSYLNALDAMVQGFASKGVATILDMNQVRWSPAATHIPLPDGHTVCGTGMPTWLYPSGLGLGDLARVETAFFGGKGDALDQFIEAWRFVVRHYRKEPLVVGADLLNEPYDILVTSYPGGTSILPADLKLKEFYEKVGSAIREANPDLLLVFEDNRSKRTSRWTVVDRPDLPNAVYSMHFYPAYWTAPEGLARLQRYVDRSRKWDLPMWIGEFNAFRYTSAFPAAPSWAGDLEKFLAYTKKNEVSWTIWAYGGGRFQLPGSSVPKPGIVDIIKAGL
jgi:hypothetical protein